MQSLEVDSGQVTRPIQFASSNQAKTVTIPKATFRCLYLSAAVLVIVCIVLVATRSGSATCSDSLGDPCDIVAIKNPLGLKLSSKLDGKPCTNNFRITYEDSQQKAVSPWHHTPLQVDASVSDEFNMVVEIPRYSKRKWELSTTSENNPIKQDVKNGKLREYPGPIYWNYGALPRTFESPNVGKTGKDLELDDAEKKFIGDGDPLDVVEIGDQTFKVGEIVKVKVLGVLAMIDSGEVDWKLIAINTGDPRAADLTLDNIEGKMPGVVSGILEWFRWYKMPDTNELNIFGRAGKPFDKEMALEVIKETHEQWKELIKNWVPKRSGGIWVPKDFDSAKADKQIGIVA